VEHYNRAVGSLERKVLPGARKFVELGIRPKKVMEPTEALESLPRELDDDTTENDVPASASRESDDKTLQ
jgi:DNA recombination protein RmuC